MPENWLNVIYAPEGARDTLAALGCQNVHLRTGQKGEPQRSLVFRGRE